MKPINIKEILGAVQRFAKLYRQSRVIEQQQAQMDAYISAVDKVAIVSQTDTKGKILWANDIFCETSKYSKEELIGQHHNIIRHPDVAKEVFEDMWTTIQSGKTWHGKVKNRAKDGTAYYTDATIIPIFDANSKITGYYGIRFLITKEIEDQRKVKQFFMSERNKLIKKHQADLAPLKTELMQTKKLLQQNSGSQDVVNELNNRVMTANKKVAQLTSQIKHYEVLNKDLTKKTEDMSVNARAKLDDMIKKLNVMKEEKEIAQRTAMNMKADVEDKTKAIDSLQQSLQSRIDRITDLEDLLKFREDEIYDLEHPNEEKRHKKKK
jgi:PAS domain S-box-containing protein